MFGLVISFQGNMIMVYYPEISSYLKEVENLRTCKNMKTTCDNLCNYGRDCENIYFALYRLVRKILNQAWILLVGDRVCTYVIYKINYYLRKLGQEYLSNVTKSLYFLKGNLEYFIAHSMLFVCLDIKLSDTP